jgi:hypothetical protein
MSYKLGETAKLTSAIVPGLFSAGDLTPIIIDRMGFYDAIVLLKVGAATGTPTAQGVSLKVYTGDVADGTDATTEVSGDGIAALTTDNAEAEKNLDLNSYHRYIKIVPTVAFTAGTTPKIPVAVTVALGRPVNVPV